MSGLTCAYNVQPNGVAELLEWDDLSQAYARGGWDWIHLERGDDVARAWLFKDSGLCRNSIDALLASETRPRCMTTQEGTLLIFHDVNLEKNSQPVDKGTVRLWIEKDRIISVSCQNLDAIRNIRSDCNSNVAPETPGDFVLKLAVGVAERMGCVLRLIDESVDELEDVQDTADIAAVRKNVVGVRHQLIPLRRYFLPQRDALSDLYAANAIGLNDLQQRRLHEIADAMTRYVEDLLATRESLSVIHDSIANRNAERLNQIMLVLSIAGAVFLPLGFLVGLLGVNVGGIPGANEHDAFWIVTFLMVAIGVIELAIFRRLRWI